jgi:hypothetical protein
MFGPRTNGRHRLVECNQLQSTNSRQMQQRGVRHLSVAADFWHQYLERGCRERWCCFRILMIRMGDETVGRCIAAWQSIDTPTSWGFNERRRNPVCVNRQVAHPAVASRANQRCAAS